MVRKSCTTSVTHPLVVVTENRRKAIFRNPQKKRYEVTKIDNCLVIDGPRSDYLVSEVNYASVVVELKGCDISHACEQLLSTVGHPSVIPLLEKRIGFLIVCSRYPRFDTYVIKAKTKCARQYRAGLHIVCNQREFEIERMIQIDDS